MPDRLPAQLANELDELEWPFRSELGLSASARRTPADVIAGIRGDAEAIREHIAALTHDLETFQDIQQLIATLKPRGGPRGPRGRRKQAQASLFW